LKKIVFPTAKGSAIDCGNQNCARFRPLGKISHPRPNREVADWLERLLRKGAIVYVPEIADYEVRRELIRAGLQKGVDRLDRLKSVLQYLPINTEMMLRAAQLWAEARNRGTPTADPRRSTLT